MDDIYDNGSVAASLEDFEHPYDRSPTFNPSLNNSVFRLEDQSEPESDRSSAPWSPPAWRKGASGWLKHHRLPPPGGASVSHSTSPLYESAGEGDDTLLPRNVPLPPSPPKETPGYSPEKSSRYSMNDFPQPFGGGQPSETRERERTTSPLPEGNYIRFAMRAEVQHRTDPYDGAILWIRDKWRSMTWLSTLGAVCAAFIAWSMMRSLFQTPTPLPTPDMLKAAQIARTFEPLIYYSESGTQHISDIQDTSVAVWDLGESVRSSNFTSAPIIVNQLDELSESFKNLAVVLTSFFSNVEGDVDSILIVMEWAKRRLATIDTTPAGGIASAVDNMHSMLSRAGILDSGSGPTALGSLVKMTLGETPSQRNAATLRRTFNEFLNVLEESINNELQLALKVFAEFERIDGQLQNIQRSVARETDSLDREEGEMLSSLWTRLIGARANELRKFEKNKNLLASVRNTSVMNKHVLLDHNGKLLQLKANLEVLRKRIVSPLVRSNDSSVVSVEAQVEGLESTYSHLKEVRERQRRKTMENLYASATRRVYVGREGMGEIEGR